MALHFYYKDENFTLITITGLHALLRKKKEISRRRKSVHVCHVVHACAPHRACRKARRTVKKVSLRGSTPKPPAINNCLGSGPKASPHTGALVSSRDRQHISMPNGLVLTPIRYINIILTVVLVSHKVLGFTYSLETLTS